MIDTASRRRRDRCPCALRQHGRVGVEEPVEGGEGVGVGLADLPGLRQDRDGETGGLSAAEPDVQVDTVGLVQGDVVDEADGACAVPLRRVGVGPECGEICC